MPSFLEACEEAARAGGEVLLSWVGRFAAKEKGPADLVTEADLASQEAIRRIVLGYYPDHRFVGEEDGPGWDASRSREEAAFHWIVDPLDGTTNYVRGIPHYAVSIALAQGNRLLAGVVYDPQLKECFSAAAGAGATLNGRRIKTDPKITLPQAMVAASFPAKVPADWPTLREFTAVVPRCHSIRRCGSAALNLAYVAAGRFDAYWARDLKPWDAAAGALLVTEAGGLVTKLDGAPFDIWNPLLLATAGAPLQRELIALIANPEGA